MRLTMPALKIVYRNLAELVRFIGQLASCAFVLLSPRATAANMTAASCAGRGGIVGVVRPDST